LGRYRLPRHVTGGRVGIILTSGRAVVPHIRLRRGYLRRIGYRIRIDGRRVKVESGSDCPPPAVATAVVAVIPVAAAPRIVIEMATVIVVSMPAAMVVTIMVLGDRGSGDERKGEPESDKSHTSQCKRPARRLKVDRQL
jgi:hypothetical protein